MNMFSRNDVGVLNSCVPISRDPASVSRGTHLHISYLLNAVYMYIRCYKVLRQYPLGYLRSVITLGLIFVIKQVRYEDKRECFSNGV